LCKPGLHNHLNKSPFTGAEGQRGFVLLDVGGAGQWLAWGITLWSIVE
jgi:hypothetical protein